MKNGSPQARHAKLVGNMFAPLIVRRARARASAVSLIGLVYVRCSVQLVRPALRVLDVQSSAMDELHEQYDFLRSQYDKNKDETTL
eukprot:SAG31_NODE_29313_length_397_cov_0.781879_1_plen_85_part_01